VAILEAAAAALTADGFAEVRQVGLWQLEYLLGQNDEAGFFECTDTALEFAGGLVEREDN
jgi:hypothetical protein